MISVCIFCFICATHSPCASHAATTQEYLFRNNEMRNHGTYNSIPAHKDVPGPEKLKTYFSVNVLDNAIKNGRRHRLEKRNSDISDSVDLDFIKKIFELYGDGETMNIQGFQSLVTQLKSDHHSANLENRQTETPSQLNETDVVNKTVRFFYYI